MSQFLSLILVLVVLHSVVMLSSAFRSSPLLRAGVSFRAFSLKSVAIATPGTPNHKITFENNGQSISPWHDIPYKEGDLYNAVIEISKFTKAKMEISTKEASNPIVQDVKNGKLRDYHGPIFWNYGAIPQTWEDPNIIHPEVKCKGDNDPLDVVEIGSTVIPTGAVVKLKVLGVLAMIDDGELDWKVIGINSQDPIAKTLHDISDVDPRVVSGIREWFRWYKTPDGKPLNTFGYDEKVLPKKFAEGIIEETHHHWKELVDGKSEKGKLWIK